MRESRNALARPSSVRTETAQKELAKLTRDMADELGALADVPPSIKARKRTEEKIDADYGGDASQIMDLARSTLVFKNLADL